MSRQEVQYQTRDWVFLKLQPYLLHSFARWPNEKLSPHYYKPYQILEKIGTITYKLAFPSYAKIHPLFHVSHLKKVIRSQVISQPLPSCLTEDVKLNVQPEEVLTIRGHSLDALKVLVRWEGLPLEESS